MLHRYYTFFFQNIYVILQNFPIATCCVKLAARFKGTLTCHHDIERFQVDDERYVEVADSRQCVILRLGGRAKD
jgi:hypothetical protein